MKTTPEGDVEWSMRYSPVSAHVQPVAVPSTLGGFLIVGKVLFSSQSATALVRIDGEGSIISQQALVKPGHTPSAFQPLVLANGDLLVADYAFTGFALTRIAPSGDIIWSHTRAMASTMNWVEIAEPRVDAYETLTGDIVACGAMLAPSASMDAAVIKVSADGTLLWHRTFGGAGADGFRYILPTADGGTLAFGSMNNTGSPQILVVKLTTDGSVQWQKTYGGVLPHRDKFLLPLPNGNFLVGANVTNASIGATHPLLFELNGNGAVMWTEAYDYGETHAFGRINGSGGDFIGYKFYSNGAYHPILRKMVDIREHCEHVGFHDLAVSNVVLESTAPLSLSAGNSLMATAIDADTANVPAVELCFQSAIPEGEAAIESLSVAPNPVSQRCALIGAAHARIEALLLYDGLGRMITDLTSLAHDEIDLSFLSPGHYYFRLVFSDAETRAIRVVVARP